jgi:hypothetical protein
MLGTLAVHAYQHPELHVLPYDNMEEVFLNAADKPHEQLRASSVWYIGPKWPQLTRRMPYALDGAIVWCRLSHI